MSRFRPSSPSVLAALTLLLAAGALAPPGAAELCAIDNVPAATLLLPFFAVDVKKASAPDTVFSIDNLNAAPTAAQVTLWSQASVPAVSFAVPLTGFDVETFSLREIVSGALFEEIDPSCVALNGSNLNQALGKLISGKIASGYVTIDNVHDACTPLFPSDEGYFVSGGKGLASNANTLSGEYYVNVKASLAGTRLVPIEAGSNSRVTTPGNYTFYGRYSKFDARDNREPLARSWAARFDIDNGNKAYLQIWRDSGPFNQPLLNDAAAVFDEKENSQTLVNHALFPLEAQEVKIGSAALPTSVDGGWVYLNLNHSGKPLQSFVVVRQEVKKRKAMFWAAEFNPAGEGGSSACGPAPTN